MKRTIFTALLSLTAIAAGAQTMYDGLNYSQNNYYGTARSIGMGNAMTAVGGDLGSIGINPAGSAVAGYSQFTITPNLTLSSMNSSYSAYPVGGADNFSNERTRESHQVLDAEHRPDIQLEDRKRKRAERHHLRIRGQRHEQLHRQDDGRRRNDKTS